MAWSGPTERQFALWGRHPSCAPPIERRFRPAIGCLPYANEAPALSKRCTGKRSRGES